MNKQSLEKLHDEGIAVKSNERIHARIFNLYIQEKDDIIPLCLLIGSFDFNLNAVTTERYDVGIRTKHPELTRKAVDFFERIWNDKFSSDMF